jgi:hypothetical protein
MPQNRIKHVDAVMYNMAGMPPEDFRALENRANDLEAVGFSDPLRQILVVDANAAQGRLPD